MHASQKHVCTINPNKTLNSYVAITAPLTHVRVMLLKYFSSRLYVEQETARMPRAFVLEF